MASLVTILVPLAVDLLRAYFKTTDSKNDDLVLETVQMGCKYLEPKQNNTVDQLAVNITNSHEMIKGEK